MLSGNKKTELNTYKNYFIFLFNVLYCLFCQQN